MTAHDTSGVYARVELSELTNGNVIYAGDAVKGVAILDGVIKGIRWSGGLLLSSGLCESHFAIFSDNEFLSDLEEGRIGDLVPLDELSIAHLVLASD